MRRTIALLVLLLASGCRSHVIVVKVENMDSSVKRNIEVTYPGGSFGISALQGGEARESKIKPFASGPVSIAFVDSAGASHKKSGPLVNKDDQGRIEFHIGAKDVHIAPNIKE